MELFQGVLICVAGLGMLVASDEITGKDWKAVSKGKGDGFMIGGATLYGFSTCSWSISLSAFNILWYKANATEEFFVRKRPFYEVYLYFFAIEGIYLYPAASLQR
jgi:solute carrier family 35, member F1/2